VQLLRGWGDFISANAVRVLGADGSEHTVTADNILLATGGTPWHPTDIPGAELGITSDGFWELDTVPKHAVVVGGGYIGTELAGILASHGSKVTMALRGECLLNGFDPMIRSNTRALMEAQGITVACGVQITKVLGEPGNLTVHLDDGSQVEGVDCLLWATGRVPNTQRLNLAAAGVQDQSTGKIAVDEFQATNVPGVFALGDIVDTASLTPVAIAAGRLLADRLFGGFPDAKLDYSKIPTVVFAHPPIGTIGLSEPQAAEKYGEGGYKVYTSRFNSLYYGVQEHKVGTVMKLVTAGEREEIVGLHVQGQGADEMLQGFGVALKMGATKADFDSCVAIHPTSAEEFVTMPPWVPHSQGAKVGGAAQE
jgi:glutathione reductase (NADPH)